MSAAVPKKGTNWNCHQYDIDCQIVELTLYPHPQLGRIPFLSRFAFHIVETPMYEHQILAGLCCLCSLSRPSLGPARQDRRCPVVRPDGIATEISFGHGRHLGEGKRKL